MPAQLHRCWRQYSGSRLCIPARAEWPQSPDPGKESPERRACTVNVEKDTRLGDLQSRGGLRLPPNATRLLETMPGVRELLRSKGTICRECVLFFTIYRA